MSEYYLRAIKNPTSPSGHYIETGVNGICLKIVERQGKVEKNVEEEVEDLKPFYIATYNRYEPEWILDYYKWTTEKFMLPHPKYPDNTSSILITNALRDNVIATLFLPGVLSRLSTLLGYKNLIVENCDNSFARIIPFPNGYGPKEVDIVYYRKNNTLNNFKIEEL